MADAAMDADDFARAYGTDALRDHIDRNSRNYRGNGTKARGRRLKAVADLKLCTSAEYLLKGWIYRGDFVTIFGAAGCGKSLFAVDLFYRIALGKERIHGKRARKAVVLYVCLEGQRGFEQRLIALRQRYGLARGFTLDNSTPLNLTKEEDVKELAETAKRIGADVIVIDTWSQATPGCEEASSADMGRAMAAVDRLRGETGASSS